MRALVLLLVLLCAAPAHADRRTTARALFGLGVGMAAVTVALGILGSWGNSGDCVRRSGSDACQNMMLAGDAGGGIAAPLALGLMISGGVLSDRSAESASRSPDVASLLRLRF
jgi:hypothetical protein